MECTGGGNVNNKSKAVNIRRNNKLQNAIVDSIRFDVIYVKDPSRSIEACYNI